MDIQRKSPGQSHIEYTVNVGDRLAASSPGSSKARCLPQTKPQGQSRIDRPDTRDAKQRFPPPQRLRKKPQFVHVFRRRQEAGGKSGQLLSGSGAHKQCHGAYSLQ